MDVELWVSQIIAAAGERVGERGVENYELPPKLEVRRKGKGTCPKCAGPTWTSYCRPCGPRLPASIG